MLGIQRNILINESIVCANVDGEAVLLNVETGLYFGLNQVGTRIWELLAEGKSGDEIATQLADEYNVEQERLDSELSTFLNLLLVNGLAKLVSE